VVSGSRRSDRVPSVEYMTDNLNARAFLQQYHYMGGKEKKQGILSKVPGAQVASA
jgi:hypothetical protein